MYPYITFSDETEVTYSNIIERNGQREIEVHFERATENGFDTARCILPAYNWIIKEGFAENEFLFFGQFLQNNAHLFYRYSEKGGTKVA
jgi:hypothetical protein